MARAQGINTDFTKVLGLVLSNGLVALSGALLAQYNSASEINMGRGAIVYYIVIQAVLAMGLNANYLKLLSAVVVAIFLSIPYWKGKYIHAKVRSGAEMGGNGHA